MTARIKIPPGWDKVALSDVLDQRSELIQPEGNGDTRFVGLEHIGSGEPALYSWASDTDVKSTKFRFYEGDLLYGKLRPYLDKAVESSFEGICSTDILTLVPKIERESTKYLLYTIHSRPFIQYAISHTSGTNHPRTSWKAISRYEFPLPPKKERQKIGAILSAVDVVIQKSKVATKATEYLKQGVMRELLMKGIGHTEFKEDKMSRRLPKSWCPKTIADLFEIKTGTTPPTKASKYWKDGTIQWYTPADLSNVGEKVLLPESGKKITAEACKETNVNLVPPDTIILSTRAPVGTIGITKKEATFNQGCKGLIPHNGVGTNVRFYYYYLQFKKSDLVNRSSGSTFKELSKDQLESYIVPLPASSEQKSIATILSTIDRKLDLQRQRTAALDRLKQGLMNDLLTGKRRVVA